MYYFSVLFYIIPLLLLYLIPYFILFLSFCISGSAKKIILAFIKIFSIFLTLFLPISHSLLLSSLVSLSFAIFLFLLIYHVLLLCPILYYSSPATVSHSLFIYFLSYCIPFPISLFLYFPRCDLDLYKVYFYCFQNHLTMFLRVFHVDFMKLKK